MKRYSFIKGLLIFAIILSALSCKKDKKSENANYMKGSATFTLPTHMLAGSQITLKGEGITEPTTGLTYHWLAKGFSPDSVVTQSVTLTAPTKHGDYTIFLTIKHDDYTATSATRSVTIINLEDPESYPGVPKGQNFIIDQRDGTKYYYKKIGNLEWFISDLNWEGAGKPYNNTSALGQIFGRLYTWQEATGGVAASGLGNGPQGIAPEGWRIPTREDWEDLATALNGSPLPFDSDWPGLGEKASVNPPLNGKNIWKYSPDNTKKNSFGWNALPGGSSTNQFKSFANMGLYGFWWSASLKDADQAEYRYIHFDDAKFPHHFAGKDFFAASVRCVRKAN